MMADPYAGIGRELGAPAAAHAPMAAPVEMAAPPPMPVANEMPPPAAMPPPMSPPVPMAGPADPYAGLGSVLGAGPTYATTSPKHAKDALEIGRLDAGSLWENLKLRAKTMFTGDPEELATVVEKALPGAKILRDADNNPLIEYKGQTVALNRPGFSLQDVVPVGTAVAENIGLGIATGGASLPTLGARLLAQGGIGAATGTMNTAAREATGADIKPKDYAVESTIGAAGGAAGELLSSGLGAVLSRFRGGILDNAGRLNGNAVLAFRQAGVDPKALAPDVLQSIDQQLKGRVVSPETVGATRRTAVAAKYDMPLSAGEASRDLTQLQVEEEMRQGVRGSLAAGPLRGLREGQQGRAGQIIANAEGRIAPNAILTPTETGLGDVVSQGVTKARDTSRTNVRKLYKAFEDQAGAAPITLPPDPGLSAAAKKAIEGKMISPELAPSTAHILAKLDEVAAGPLDLKHSEVVRKEIQSAINSAHDGKRFEDEAAAIALRNAYAKWVDQSVDSLPDVYAPGTLASLKKARGAASEHFGKFRASDPGDKGGKLVEGILRGRVEPQQVVDTVMGNRVGFDPSGAPIARRLRTTLGDKSPEWESIQRGMVRRILLGGADAQSTGLPEWGTMLARVDKALEGRGQDMAAQHLGIKGVAELEGLRDVLKSLEVPKDAVNRSGSGNLLARVMRPQRGAIGGAMAGGAVDLLSAYGLLPPLVPFKGAATVAGMAAGRGVQNAADYFRALQAARGYRAPVRPLIPQGGGTLPAIASGAALGGR